MIIIRIILCATKTVKFMIFTLKNIRISQSEKIIHVICVQLENENFSSCYKTHQFPRNITEDMTSVSSTVAIALPGRVLCNVNNIILLHGHGSDCHRDLFPEL